MATNVEEGFSGGAPVVANFPLVGRPLLRGFYFQYVNDDHDLSERLDRHVLALSVLPAVPAAGKIVLGMHENGHDTDFFFRVVHDMVADDRIRSFTRGLDVAAGRETTVQVERPPGDMVFVLAGFELAFHGDDHHLDEAGIFERDGAVTIRFNDKNDDDTFKFRLHYSYVPRAMFSAIGTVRGDDDSGGARRSIPQGKAVLRGFNLNFRSEDHHIRDVGALVTTDGRAEVFFEDKNGDDGFDWSLGWGVLA